MKINLLTNNPKESYFSIIINDTTLYTSLEIAYLLNLNVKFYNKLLIDKVIKHEHYKVENYAEFNLEDIVSGGDLVFDLYNTPEETYIDRFKETFTEQLTLLALGGV